MADYETHDFDVIVIGAGGAGLRAAIEANAGGPAHRARSASPCWARPTRSWPRAGSRPPLGNVYQEDNWQVHFRDTMRGGKMLNNWRMAQLHAQESPDRVRELEDWGALFDRTDGRPHPPARLRRPPLRPSGPRRRPHRARADPHPAAEGGGRRASRCSWRSRSSASCTTPTGRCRGWSGTGGPPASSSSSRPRRWSWPPAASARAGCTPPTRGSPPATGTPWPCGPAPT